MKGTFMVVVALAASAVAATSARATLFPPPGPIDLQTAPVVFSSQANDNTYFSPSGLAVGDVTGDGVADIVTTYSPGNTVTILRGKGDGTFPTRSFVTTAPEANAVAIADLNGDGIPDIVTSDYDYCTTTCAGRVSILLGTGGGAFRHTSDVALHGAEAHGIAVGDMNGDGIPDIVAATAIGAPNGQGELTVLRGRGDGTFFWTSDTYAPTARLVALGDVNGDGILDAVSIDGQSSVGVFLGWGNGSFHAPTTVTFGGTLADVRLADATGDHVPDIVVADSSNTSGGAWIAAGQSGGTFAAPFELAIPDGAIDVTVGDLNHDGVPDLVALASAGSGASDAWVIRGKYFSLWRPAYEAATTTSLSGTYAGNASPGYQFVALSDLNGDGKPDVVATDSPDELASVLMNGS